MAAQNAQVGESAGRRPPRLRLACLSPAAAAFPWLADMLVLTRRRSVPCRSPRRQPWTGASSRHAARLSRNPFLSQSQFSPAHASESAPPPEPPPSRRRSRPARSSSSPSAPTPSPPAASFSAPSPSTSSPPASTSTTSTARAAPATSASRRSTSASSAASRTSRPSASWRVALPPLFDSRWVAVHFSSFLVHSRSTPVVSVSSWNASVHFLLDAPPSSVALPPGAQSRASALLQR